MNRSLLSCALICLVLVPAGAHAQSTTQTIGVYQASWNMVGGPPDTDFSSAAYLYAWQGGTYVVPASRTATLCTGYWAYFGDPEAIPLPLGAIGPTQACPLQPGWNLVGNPFAGDALLPSGMTGYVWDPLSNTYLVVTSVHAGQSVWVYAPAVGSVTFTFSPAPPNNAPTTLTINSLAGSGPYQIHVGDSVKLLVQTILNANAMADPHFLLLETSGELVSLTCTTGNNCRANATALFWTWRAVAPGTTYIAVVPYCLLSTPACAVPTQAIQIDILP